MAELRADFVKGCVYANERTKNRARGDFSGAPTSYLRGWAVGFGQKPKPFLLTDAMLREGFLIAERNPEDAGVWLPPAVPGPRAESERPHWMPVVALAVFTFLVGVGAGFAL